MVDCMSRACSRNWSTRDSTLPSSPAVEGRRTPPVWRSSPAGFSLGRRDSVLARLAQGPHRSGPAYRPPSPGQALREFLNGSAHRAAIGEHVLQLPYQPGGSLRCWTSRSSRRCRMSELRPPTYHCRAVALAFQDLGFAAGYIAHSDQSLQKTRSQPAEAPLRGCKVRDSPKSLARARLAGDAGISQNSWDWRTGRAS